MLEDFLSYIVEELSVRNTDKLLLAVSGGMDSMVMLDLFRRAKHTVSVAHINHSTRNGGSDEDELFLKNYCEKHQIKFFSIKLDYDKLSQGNFQQNARIARYEFFDQLINEHAFDYLATAHHMDDRWETFVMNLNRKSGIHGLTSLKNEFGNLIRPLLGFSRSDIETYATKNKIEYKEDSSNNSDDYTRNRIRHHISTKVEEVLPGFISNANDSIIKLEKTQSLLGELIQKSEFIVLDKKTSYHKIDLSKIKAFEHADSLAYEILRTFDFSFSDISDMLATNQTGSTFISSSHEALYDRGIIIIRPKQESAPVSFVLDAYGYYPLVDGRTITYQLVEDNQTPNHLYLSYDKLIDKRLIIRSITPGDSFYPEGMNGKRKTLKKYLNDLKLDKFEREKQLVLEVDNEIALVIGRRCSTYFKANESEQKIAITIQ